MLVLTRKSGQEIRIGENILIKVISTKYQRVKLGIEAPLELGIHRSESSWQGSEKLPEKEIVKSI